ncbi:unnamed protein product [Linum trigynum]|uniref:Uncharacterized protein n=1 Tax=Linum trigynum TaxID=586398 RepID=A0AAV2GNP9_9ROSI
MRGRNDTVYYESCFLLSPCCCYRRPTVAGDNLLVIVGRCGWTGSFAREVKEKAPRHRRREQALVVVMGIVISAVDYRKLPPTTRVSCLSRRRCSYGELKSKASTLSTTKGASLSKQEAPGKLEPKRRYLLRLLRELKQA